MPLQNPDGRTQMEFDISPFKAVNQIEFGMTPEQVRVAMKTQPMSFKKCPVDVFPADHFEAAGAFFYYDADSRLEAAEFASPAHAILLILPIQNVRA